MSAGGQDMPGGKTRDQWLRQAAEIERLTADNALLQLASKRADNIEKHRDELYARIKVLEDEVRNQKIEVSNRDGELKQQAFLAAEYREEITKLDATLRGAYTENKDYAKRIKVLETENEKLRTPLGRDMELLAEDARMTKRIKVLESALTKYGDHDGDCLVGQEPYYICDCGFTNAIAAAEKEDE